VGAGGRSGGFRCSSRPYIALTLARVNRQQSRKVLVCSSLYATSGNTMLAHTARPLSVGMEDHTDGLEPERLISSSCRPRGWRSLIAVATKQPCKRRHARIREQWGSHVRAQAESGSPARECCHGYGPPTRTQCAVFSRLCSSSERFTFAEPNRGLRFLEYVPVDSGDQIRYNCLCNLETVSRIEHSSGVREGSDHER
jgi:hypothetical protein